MTTEVIGPVIVDVAPEGDEPASGLNAALTSLRTITEPITQRAAEIFGGPSVLHVDENPARNTPFTFEPGTRVEVFTHVVVPTHEPDFNTATYSESLGIMTVKDKITVNISGTSHGRTVDTLRTTPPASYKPEGRVANRLASLNARGVVTDGTYTAMVNTRRSRQGR